MNASSQPARSIVSAVRDRLWAATHAGIAHLVYANGGLGDELMLTAIAREARCVGRPIAVLSNLPQVWLDNRDPVRLETNANRWFYARRRNWIGTTLQHLPYDSARQGRHIAQQMADHLGLTLPDGWRPILNLQPSRRLPRRIVVQNSCRGARYSATTKEWPEHRWTELVSQLRGFEILHVGTDRDPPLQGVTDLRGKTSLREAARLIASSACFVGLESGLMHVAAAVETPAVIVYGGRTLPQQTGYSSQLHITRQPPCAGCALNDGCPHQMMCMDISVDELRSGIETVLRTA